MKKLCSLALTGCVLVVAAFSLLTGRTFAAGANIQLSADEEVYAPGQKVEIAVGLDAQKEIHGVQLDLTFDADILRFDDAAYDTPEEWFAEAAILPSGELRLLAYDQSPEAAVSQSGQVALCTLTFTVQNTDASSTALAAHDGKTADRSGTLVSRADGGSLSLALSGGQPEGEITKVLPATLFTPCGHAPVLPTEIGVEYKNGQTGVLPVQWEAVDPDQYAAPGTFTLSGTVAGTDLAAEARITVYLPGDLDKDGEVTIADVMEACKVMAREAAGTDPTDDEVVRGDLDADEEITIADVMEICKILAREG